MAPCTDNTIARQAAGTCSKSNFPGLLMSSFALPERPRSRRAKYPKVRTGCISCKKRHVKCDEAKPACNRCLKWSGVCSGYAPPPPAKTSPVPTPEPKPKKGSPRPIMMRTEPSPLLSVPAVDDRFSSCSPSPSTPPTPTLNGYGYNAIGSIVDQYDPIQAEASILDAAFWTDTVPRLVRDNLAVRYANMAVHILILSKQPELIVSDGSSDGQDHYSQALGYYGLAIRQMRDAHEAGGNLRAAILCSMFFVIFEAINGDKDAAEAHLQCGQRMLDNLFSLLPQSAIIGSSAGSLRKEIRNLLQYISLQVRIGGVNCWKGEMDAFYTNYLEDYLVPEQDDAMLALCDPDLFLPEMYFQDDLM